MIICGDCLDVMRGMDAMSIDAIVTDPPYGLGFMGKDWDHGIPGVHFWQDAIRIAKPGCHLLAFGGTRMFHRLACVIEDAGWEIRDCLGWLYGSGFPKSHNLKGEREGWGTALKPAWEPIILARKPLDGTVAENVQKWGTGAINVDGCRVEAKDGQLAKKYASVRNAPARKNLVYGKDCRPRSEGNLEPHPKGRWPANLLHDGSDEVLELFPQSSITGERQIKNRIQQRAVSTPFTRGQNAAEYTDSGSVARFFYCADRKSVV